LKLEVSPRAESELETIRGCLWNYLLEKSTLGRKNMATSSGELSNLARSPSPSSSPSPL